MQIGCTMITENQHCIAEVISLFQELLMSIETMFHITPVSTATYEHVSIYKQRGFNKTQVNYLTHFSVKQQASLRRDKRIRQEPCELLKRVIKRGEG